jgi:hypothetical protein
MEPKTANRKLETGNLRLAAWLACALLLAAAAARGAAKEAGEKGVFHIVVDGREIGVERFEIAPVPQGLRATAELQMQVEGVGRMVETSTLLLRGGIEPIKYERVQKSPKHGTVTVDFGPEKASAHYKTSEGGTQDMAFYVPKDVVVLDTNFFHHYTLLVRQYDFIKSGPQHMNVLVPQEASPGMVRVEYAGPDQGLRKLTATTDAMQIEIWTNDAGQVMKLAAPAAKVEVTREVK